MCGDQRRHLRKGALVRRIGEDQKRLRVLLRLRKGALEGCWLTHVDDGQFQA